MQKVVIMGAAGRDFHNFNVFFRKNENYKVVAFTATQIPYIDDRKYPASLAGPQYADGVPIIPEEKLDELIKKEDIDVVVFSYSDISHSELMHKASQVLSMGADFWLLGPKHTMLRSNKPVISVCATRTGCGKSQVSRKIVDILKGLGKKPVAIRHPMPYGQLEKQEVERFATFEDLNRFQCTIEEREEYEPYIERGAVVFAGVDYGEILQGAETEADFIVWDGGNNDFSFYQSDLEIVVADALRPGHEISYHPGEINLRRAQVIIINKIDSANREDVFELRGNIEKLNPKAQIIEAASPISVKEWKQISGRNVLVIEDGPTLTHGEMAFGAGTIAARKYNAKEMVDPRPFAKGSIAESLKHYPKLGPLLPNLGYGPKQVQDLEDTINATPADLVLVASPIDLSKLIKVNKPILRVRYELQEIGEPTLESVIKDRFFK